MKKTTKPPKSLLSPDEAGRALKVDRHTIYRWLWAKKLKGLRKGGTRWVIPTREAVRLKNKRRQF